MRKLGFETSNSFNTRDLHFFKNDPFNVPEEMDGPWTAESAREFCGNSFYNNWHKFYT